MTNVEELLDAASSTILGLLRWCGDLAVVMRRKAGVTETASFANTMFAVKSFSRALVTGRGHSIGFRPSDIIQHRWHLCLEESLVLSVVVRERKRSRRGEAALVARRNGRQWLGVGVADSSVHSHGVEC